MFIEFGPRRLLTPQEKELSSSATELLATTQLLRSQILMGLRYKHLTPIGVKAFIIRHFG